MNKKIRSIADLEFVAKSVDHVLTLFSGGLDSSYVLSILSQYDVKVTALAVDLGDDIDIDQLQIIAQHYGVNLIIADAKEEFANTHICRAIQAQALYLRDYPVSSSLSRPIIAKKAVQVAYELNCNAIIHTANQSQNSLRRLNGSIESTGFTGFYGSPYEYSAITREEKSKQLFQSGLVQHKNRNVSGDSNLWCREFESGILDDPEKLLISDSLFNWSKFDNRLHFDNNKITIAFENGKPVSVNGKSMALVELIEHLNIKVGSYEIGRFVGFDHLDADEKVIEIRESPAAIVLFQAYKLLSVAILSTDLLKIKLIHDELWTQEAVEGRWDSELQQASYAYIADSAKKITGTVTFQLSRGYFLASRVIAEKPKYLRDRDSWEIDIAKERSTRSLQQWSMISELNSQEAI